MQFVWHSLHGRCSVFELGQDYENDYRWSGSVFRNWRMDFPRPRIGRRRKRCNSNHPNFSQYLIHAWEKLYIEFFITFSLFFFMINSSLLWASVSTRYSKCLICSNYDMDSSLLILFAIFFMILIDFQWNNIVKPIFMNFLPRNWLKISIIKFLSIILLLIRRYCDLVCLRDVKNA